MVKDLAQKLRPQFEAVVAANEDPAGQAYSPDFSSAARRAVKAKALGYLSALGDSQVTADLLARYRASTNMTDTGALKRDNWRMVGKLAVVTALMFGFGYLLVPIYSYVLLWFFIYCYPIALLTRRLESRYAER